MRGWRVNAPHGIPLDLIVGLVPLSGDCSEFLQDLAGAS